jgi:hypothetical protein
MIPFLETQLLARDWERIMTNVKGPGRKNVNVTKQIAALALAVLAIPIQGAKSTPILYAAKFGIDDYNEVQAVAPVATEGGFVLTAISNSGLQNARWVWTLANAADSAAVRADTTIDPYVAWAVSQPKLQFPNGTTIQGDGSGDRGGVNVIFTFVPKAADPLIGLSLDLSGNNTGRTQLHWLQVVHESNNLGLDKTKIDSPTVSPWYDVGGAAGIATLDKIGSWLGDDPIANENGPNVPDPGAGRPGVEPVNPYEKSVRFETYLAVDNIVNKVNDVTLYGGWAWGFDYTATDGPLRRTPEPATLAIFSVGLAGLVVFVRRRRAKA